MSITDFDEALLLITQHQEGAKFVGGRDGNVIAAAEEVLKVRFPPSYRRFLSTLGAGYFAGEMFYGITTGDFANGRAPNGVWATLQQRAAYGLSDPLLYIYNLGDGTQYMIDTSRVDDHDESPIVVSHGVPESGENLTVVATDFGRFFLEAIHEAVEILRRGDIS